MNRKCSSAVMVDYGMGNLFSIQRVINFLGGIVKISSDPDVIATAERLILPGVGAFGDGMNKLKERGLIEPLEDFNRSGRPFLGICLGMQLFMKEGSEFGVHYGLGFIPGTVKKLNGSMLEGQNYKIPHVGWNRIYSPCPCAPKQADDSHGKPGRWRNTVLENIKEGDFVYFVHSYAVHPDSDDMILAETFYGNEQFCSALRYKNLIGCQFHPEVSGEVGLSVLDRFLFESDSII